MYMRNVAIAGLATLLCSASAFAFSSQPAAKAPNSVHKASSLRDDETQQLSDRCSTLMSQFDEAIAAHRSAPKAAAAEHLRSKAAGECQGDLQDAGVRHLTQALKDIGIKTKA
jgi:hypothetical protein